MIGIIISGHAQFASGITSSLEMIAGKQDHYHVIDFLEENPLEQISEDIENAIIELKKECEGVIIYTDLIDGVFSRLAHDNVVEFAKLSEDTGKEQVQFVKEIEVKEDFDEGDGI